MTVVDFDELQAVQGPRVLLLANTRVGPIVTGTGYSDFSGFLSVYLTARVQVVRSDGAPSLTVTVEHSDDGNSWSAAETFTFTRDGSQSALLSSPKAHVRASAVGAGSEWYVVSVAASPTYLDESGGGLPAGGMTGQVLTKASNADGDADWEAGGGGSQPFGFHKLDVAFDTPDLNAGVEVFTPAVGELLVSCRIVVPTAWDGTTPKFDCGNGSQGLFSYAFGLPYSGLSNPDDTWPGISVGGNGGAWAGVGDAVLALDSAGYTATLSPFATADPFLAWVSQNGNKGGAAVGGTVGTATVYVVTILPTAFA